MSGDYEEDVCRSALRLVQELCFAPRARPPHDKCLEFTDLLRHRGHPRPSDSEVSVSLLSVIVTFCGIVLLGVSLFVSWKLCWVPWRHKGGTTFPAPEEKPEQQNPPNLGQIQPELYEGDGFGGARGGSPAQHPPPCGRLAVALRYAYGSQQLVVRVLRALDLPAKDPNGFSDPYVKIYLLPDRKRKFQTKVHRKTLNPVFDETFTFGVPFGELPARRLHFSVYDFDRFSRHDLIGQVVLENLLEAAERGPEVPIWRDIQEGGGEKADLGEVNFSLCYLPTAGRLTVTVIRASNLRAMDLTGYSDPYVKASLMAEGRRLKKRKTSIKKNTLNPSYNEALVFDVPHESVHHVSLTIAVVDYDCIGHNEVIGLCRVGGDAEGAGREHWERMLANPRKPIEHWHTLVEAAAPAWLGGPRHRSHRDPRAPPGAPDLHDKGGPGPPPTVNPGVRVWGGPPRAPPSPPAAKQRTQASGAAPGAAAGAERSRTEPNGAERGRTEPNGAERSRTGPNGAERSRTEPNGAERSRTEPNGAERSRTEPNGAERSRTEPNGAERSRTNPNGPERSRTEPNPTPNPEPKPKAEPNRGRSRTGPEAEPKRSRAGPRRLRSAMLRPGP
ncbi:synaptotagmin-C-like, partial [Aegotheles albertisi]